MTKWCQCTTVLYVLTLVRETDQLDWSVRLVSCPFGLVTSWARKMTWNWDLVPLCCMITFWAPLRPWQNGVSVQLRIHIWFQCHLRRHNESPMCCFSWPCPIQCLSHWRWLWAGNFWVLCVGMIELRQMGWSVRYGNLDDWYMQGVDSTLKKLGQRLVWSGLILCHVQYCLLYRQFNY